MNTPHVHAELIKKWADNPALPVYVFSVKSGKWQPVEGYFSWHPELEYHVGSNPPQRQLIHRYDVGVVPVGLTYMYENGENGYYVPALTEAGYRQLKLDEKELNKLLLDKSLVFDNPEDAIKVTKVMLDGF